MNFNLRKFYKNYYQIIFGEKFQNFEIDENYLLEKIKELNFEKNENFNYEKLFENLFKFY